MTNEHFKNKYLKYKNKYYDLVNKKYSLKNNKHKIAGGTALEIAGGLTGILLIIAIIIYFVNYKEEKIEPTPLSSEIVPTNILSETETAPAQAQAPKPATDKTAKKPEKAPAQAEAALGLAVALSQK